MLYTMLHSFVLTAVTARNHCIEIKSELWGLGHMLTVRHVVTRICFAAM